MKSIIAFALLISTINLFGQELVFEKIPGISFNSPVEMVSTYVDGDTRLFVAQKNGFIYIIDNPEAENPMKSEEPFLDLSAVVNTSLEGGLLGVAFHPDFQENGYFFVNYTFNDPANNNTFSTRISRFTISPDNANLADPDSEEEVITINQDATNHNGGDLAFGPDGYLYIPLGDGGGANDQYDHGKNRLSLLAKVLRIDINFPPYAIPEDNPFANDDFTLDEIWSLGWRNPWRVSFDKETGDFWAADVGQGDLEEVDMEPFGTAGGRDYGWSCYEGTESFRPADCGPPSDYTFPVYEYDHSQGQKSITGGYVYRGTRHPDLVGKYIFTDFVDSKVFWLTEQISPGEFETQRIQLPSSGAPFRVSTFGEASNGELYFATYQDGRIWKVMTTVTTETTNPTVSTISIAPNPSNQRITIQGIGDNVNISNVTIVDIKGKEFKPIIINQNMLDISVFKPGIYILSFEENEKWRSVKFVKN